MWQTSRERILERSSPTSRQFSNVLRGWHYFADPQAKSFDSIKGPLATWFHTTIPTRSIKAASGEDVRCNLIFHNTYFGVTSAGIVVYPARMSTKFATHWHHHSLTYDSLKWSQSVAANQLYRVTSYFGVRSWIASRMMMVMSRSCILYCGIIRLVWAK